MNFVNKGEQFSTSTIFKDKAGKEHTVEVAGRFRDVEEFNTIVKNKLLALHKENDSEFI